MRNDFAHLIEDIKSIYISDSYLGMMSWMVDRAFVITGNMKRNINTVERKTNENKSILIKILYDVNKKNLLKIFSKNANEK